MKIGIMIFAAIGALVGLMCLEPVAQDLSYHNFADKRAMTFIPNFCDVASNVPYLVIGMMGLVFLAKQERVGAYFSWLTFFIGVTLVALGSSYYHWQPNSQTLVWDRLPMSIGFMGLFVGLLSEYIDERIERFLLIPLIILGVSSVAYWHFYDDLRFYVWVQFFPLICIFLLLTLFKSRYTHMHLIGGALTCYLLAKVFEWQDSQIFTLTGENLSGHSLKHLISALGIYFIYVMLKQRKLKT